MLLEEALMATADPRERAAVALEAAEAYAALFRWADAVDVIERALAELNGADQELAARLEGELVVCGLHDARRADRVAPVLARLGSRVSQASEPHAVAQGMRMLLAGRPAGQIAALLEQALEAAGPEAENWDTRAALLWVLVAAERFGTVETPLTPLLAQVHRGGSARGFVAPYSTLGLLKLRLGALPEADAAARVALRVLQEGDFAPGPPEPGRARPARQPRSSPRPPVRTRTMTAVQGSTVRTAPGGSRWPGTAIRPTAPGTCAARSATRAMPR